MPSTVILKISNKRPMIKFPFSDKLRTKCWLLGLVFFMIACDQRANKNEVGHIADSTDLAFTLSKIDIETNREDTSSIDGVLDLIAQYHELSTFTKAASIIHLKEILEEKEGQFTVFAPVNEAFKVSGIKIDSSNTTQYNLLKDIVLQHVVPLYTVSEVWKDEIAYKALNQGTLTITIKDSIAHVNDAKVIAKDIESPEGVLQVIDRVLIPKEEATVDEF